MNRKALYSAVFVCLFTGLTGMAVAQLPAGTRSGDDHSREDAASKQIRDAESSLEKQDYKGAEIQLKALAASHPKDGRILYDLGFAEERNGEEAAAATAYRASFTAIPGFAEPEIALGLLDARSGHTVEAHRELQDAANRTTTAPELRARAFRALAHLDEGNQPDEARDELLAALKLSPETPDDVLTGAVLAERAGDATDAEAAYRRALTLLPGDVDATAGLAHVLQQQGKLADADAVLSAALKDHPDDIRLIAQAATLYTSEGKAAQAIPLLEKLRASNPKAAANPATTHLLAQLYSINGDDAAAEKLYTVLLAATPKDPVLLDALGSAQVRLGHDAAAEATLIKTLPLRQEFHDDHAWGEAQAHLAFAASKNNDPKTCLQALAARATVLPSSPALLFLGATAHDQLHQTREAVIAYRAFLSAAGGKFPDQELEARHRLVALAHPR